MDDSKRQLIWHGMFLFVLGLLTGFVEPQFTNPLMGLGGASGRSDEWHLLIALGAVWTNVQRRTRDCCVVGAGPVGTAAIGGRHEQRSKRQQIRAGRTECK
jgi:hypothetical protein